MQVLNFYTKTAPKEAVEKYQDLLFGNSAVFGNRAVGAIDGVVPGGIVPIIAFVDRVPLLKCALKCDARKLGAILERPITNAGDRMGDCDARKIGATMEDSFADGSDRVGDLYVCQAGTIPKRIITNDGDRVAYRYTRKIGAAGKCRFADGDYAIGDRYTRQAFAIRERPLTDGNYAVRERYARNICAIGECRLVDADNFVAMNPSGNVDLGIRASTNTGNRTGGFVSIDSIGQSDRAGSRNNFLCDKNFTACRTISTGSETRFIISGSDSFPNYYSMRVRIGSASREYR